MFKILSTCKGGGYHYCRTEPPHPKANSNGLYPLHRVLIEIKLGRLLKPGEVVHHIDENKHNNHPDNLEVLTNSQHSREHRKEAELVPVLCGNCKGSLNLKPNRFRLRKKRNKSGLLFCNRSCGTQYQHKIKNLQVIVSN